MITLRRSRPLGYLIENDDGRSILVQTDWDYPSTAGSFGWSLRSVQSDRADTIEYCAPQETDTICTGHTVWKCDHLGTDGTIVCPDCGVLPVTFIEAAAAWMDENDGATAEDGGYFTDEQEAETAEIGQIGGE